MDTVSLFVVAMLVGLGGLILMAVPGAMHRSHHSHGRLHLHAPKSRLHAGKATATIAGTSRASAAVRALRFFPEPRTILSLIALFGAAGNALQHALGLSLGWATAGASVIAVGLEAALVAPLFRFVLRFQGRPSSPLTGLICESAEAVTAFRNGKGIVQVVRDGRAVQLAARLRQEQERLPVRVGDTLRIEDVDEAGGKVTVSVV